MTHPVLSVDSLAMSYGERTLFRDVSFEVAPGERVAIFGPNGCGKTTLFRLITGELAPDSGLVRLEPGLRVGYLRQEQALSEATLEEALRGTAPAARSDLSEALRRFGLGAHPPRARVNTLSGGERTRLALAGLWLNQDDLLLLDEPTNHLDLPGLAWLRDYLTAFKGTVVVISHDRAFLDEVAGRVIELSAAGVRSFTGNYSVYRHQKELEFRSQLERFEREEREEERLEQRIAEQMEWFRKAHRDAGKQGGGMVPYYRARAKKMAARAKATVSRLKRLRQERVARPTLPAAPRLDVAEAEQTGRRLILAEDLGQSFARPLFAGASFAVLRGDRVGIVGPNGCGKTSLLRLLLGLAQPASGRVWRSPSVRAYYFDQLVEMPPDRTVWETALATGDLAAEEVRRLLAHLLFSPADLRKTVGLLSHGERVRLAFARLLAGGHELLALDEPTNHLDVTAREAIEACLEEYQGTLLLISHDRYLLKRLCNRILYFQGGKVTLFPGTYAEWEEPGLGAAAQAGESDERLLLENRLAVLAGRLADAGAGPGKSALEEEYLAVARRLRLLRSRR